METGQANRAAAGWDALDLKSPDRARQRSLPEVAQEFESLLIGQLLKSMRESSGAGWMGTGSDASASSIADFAEQQVAGVMARSGGFGLAALITKGLEQKAAQADPAKPDASPAR